MMYCPACDEIFSDEHLSCPVHQRPLYKLDENKLSDAPSNDPMIGQVLEGRYEIRRHLGVGGMGHVYVGYQRSTSREVAIKVISRNFALQADFRRRFLREAYLSSQLKNPHTITIFDFGETGDEQLFMVMELLDGMPLSAMLKQAGHFTPQRAARLLAQVCRSVSEAHERRIIHRDLKPDNLFVLSPNSESEFIKVLDFGIARDIANEDVTRLTRTGLINGTPFYMAPEIVVGKPPSPAADVYALGVIFFELISGSLPYPGDTPAQVLMAHCNQPIPTLPIKAGVQGWAACQTLLEYLLAKDPKHRISNAVQLTAHFEAIAEKRPLGLHGGDDTEAALGLQNSLVPETVIAQAETFSIPMKEQREAPQAATTSAGQTNKPVQSPRLLWTGILPALICSALFFILGRNTQNNTDSATEVTTKAQATSPADQVLARAKKLGAMGQFPMAIKIARKAIELTPESPEASQLLNELLAKEVERLLRIDQGNAALNLLKETAQVLPFLDYIQRQLPQLDARLTAQGIRKGSAFRSALVRRKLKATLFKRYPGNADVYYEIGINFRKGLIPSISLTYFAEALALGKYADDPVIFDTLASVLRRTLPYDDESRSAHALEIGQKYFPEDLSNWAKKGIVETAFAVVLHSHLIDPTLKATKYDAQGIQDMLKLSRGDDLENIFDRWVKEHAVQPKEWRPLFLKKWKEEFRLSRLQPAVKERARAVITLLSTQP